MYKKFCFCFAAATIVFLLFVGMFNLLADPYGIWNICHIPGFNMRAAKTEDVERLTRPVNFLWVSPKPKVVFLGASQVRWAIDADAYQERTGASAYNFGIRGMTAYEQRRYAEHIVATDGNLREIVLGIEMSKFIDGAHFSAPHVESIFPEEEAQIGRDHIVLGNLGKTLFSFSALRGSVASIQANRVKRWATPYYTSTGTIHDDALMDFFNRNHWRFDRSMMQVQREGWFVEPKINEGCMEELRRIVTLCQEHSIRLTMVVLPMHASGMETMAVDFALYGRWLKEIIQLAPVWDFCGYNDVTESAVAEGWLREDTNQYFWDSIHPKKVTGNMMVARLLELPEARHDFGVRLVTPEDVEAHVAQLYSGHTAWMSKHPESVEAVRYYGGFSSVEPLAIQGKTWLTGRSVVRLDASARGTVFSVSLTQQERLALTGQRLTPFAEEPALYAALEASDGQRLYAMASPWESNGLADFMHSDCYAKNGFRIEEPLWDVAPGDYTLYLLEVASDGAVYRSDRLGMVTVRTQ